MDNPLLCWTCLMTFSTPTQDGPMRKELILRRQNAALWRTCRRLQKENNQLKRQLVQKNFEKVLAPQPAAGVEGSN